MTSWQITRAFAGVFILGSLLLGVPVSPLFVSSYWLLLTAFVGLNLLQSGFTHWCPLEILLHRLGARRAA
jgi:hypothetical protein